MLTVESAVRAEAEHEHGHVSTRKVGFGKRNHDDVSHTCNSLEMLECEVNQTIKPAYHWDSNVESTLLKSGRRVCDGDGAEKGEQVWRCGQEKRFVCAKAQGLDDSREEVRE